MTRLLRAYPQRWRDRYESEVTAILEDRPPTFGDRVDILRGALDAHLHPTELGGIPIPWTHRIPGVLALVGGLMWAGPVAAATLLDTDPGAGGLLGSSVILMAVSLSGEYAATYGRRMGMILGVLLAALLVTAPFGWGVFAIAAVGSYLTLAAGMLALAAIRAGIGPRGRWTIITAAMLVPALLLVTVLLISPVPPAFSTGVAVVLPFGLAWMLLGVLMVIRGSATFIDPPDLLERGVRNP